jgi:hypothetical protein
MRKIPVNVSQKSNVIERLKCQILIQEGQNPYRKRSFVGAGEKFIL